MVRILLAEDMHMVRAALAALLRLEPDFQVVAEVERGDAVLAAALECRPEVAVIDVGLPGIDGLSAAALLHAELPSCRTLILTGLGKAGALRRALSAQVSGLLLKDASPALLAEAVRRVAVGERVLDPQLAYVAFDSIEGPLTERELEVLRLAAGGAGTTEIAAALYLSAGTVRNYLTAIVTKLGARNRLDAIRIAREDGWLN
ncbi:response regulator transcription factor [Streptacidiphilus rugosus]|uniref:response regulator transcription factor n=1 Tax=Streptacidiphilus rugosus TaxID=405783 RepID=UPI000565BC04|nr:response regulator transcription factor [Streptacidiphilus rugosus]